MDYLLPAFDRLPPFDLLRLFDLRQIPLQVGDLSKIWPIWPTSTIDDDDDDIFQVKRGDGREAIA